MKQHPGEYFKAKDKDPQELTDYRIAAFALYIAKMGYTPTQGENQ